MLAFQVLYEVDLSGHNPAEVLTRFASERRPSAPVFEYARDLLAGVARHREEIDATIRQYAPTWPLEQMAATDRTVLRIALFEVLFNSTTIRVGAVINEAVALAKQFGSESSGRFVNGVLGRVAAELGRPGGSPPQSEQRPGADQT